MRILFCIDTMQKGGAERNVANLSNYLSKKNDVKILTMIDCNPEYVLNENV